MSLFLKVETASRLLGSKSPNDITYIALDQIAKIQSTGDEKGCAIYYGTPVERVVSDISPEELIRQNVVDLAAFVDVS